MDLPNIPYHGLRNMDDAELIKRIQHCDNAAIVSLCERLYEHEGNDDEIQQLEDIVSNKDQEIENLEDAVTILKDELTEEGDDIMQSQAEELLKALKVKPMTKFEIFIELGIWNSGARINELREVGHAIETKMIEHVSARWGKQKVAQYIFHAAEQKAA